MPCYPTEAQCITGSVAAAAFSAPPVLKQIAGANAFITHPVAYELLGVTLSSTLTNFGVANMGVFVLIGANTPTITLANDTPVLIQALTGTNSITGPPALAVPSDKVATTVFLQPIQVPPNVRIALYAYGDTTAGNALSVVASLVMRQAKG